MGSCKCIFVIIAKKSQLYNNLICIEIPFTCIKEIWTRYSYSWNKGTDLENPGVPLNGKHLFQRSEGCR